MRALLPVITTRRPDRRDRGYLAWVAVADEIAHLPLETAPIDASPHVLEIHVEGFDEPLVVLADPAGPPDATGAFPLRLHPLDDAHADELRAELFGRGMSAESDNADEPPDTPPPSARRSPSLSPLSPLTAHTPAVPFAPQRLDSEPPPISTGHREALARVTGAIGSTSAKRRAPGSLTGRALADGRFVLEQLLGGGASGEVYRAVHAVLRRPVAVKVLHPSLQLSEDYCARFYAEALAASQLDHKNVLRILDYGQEPDGLLYIVMELLEGRDLQQVLDQDGRLPTPRLVSLMTQACNGLGQAHEAGVVHRDIKPENIVVVNGKDDEGNPTEIVKVCDFGIAHWVPAEQKEISDDDATLVKLPDSKKVVGTPAYMAPEQIRNDPVDARTDVYSLGVVLYELATGRLPFISERPLEVLMMHVTERPPKPSTLVPDIEPELEAIILQAMEKDPEKRFQNMRVLRGALRALVDDDWSGNTGKIRRESLARHAPSAQDFVQNTADALATLATADARTRKIALASLAEALRASLLSGNVNVARDLLAWLQQRPRAGGRRARGDRQGAPRAARPRAGEGARRSAPQREGRASPGSPAHAGPLRPRRRSLAARGEARAASVARDAGQVRHVPPRDRTSGAARHPGRSRAPGRALHANRRSPRRRPPPRGPRGALGRGG